MTDYSEEELQTKITEALEKEQESIAGDQFFRESLMAVAVKVREGIYDPYIFEVGQDLYEKYKKEHPIQKRKKKTKGKKGEAAEDAS
jgi:hypothetical protein